MPLQIRRGTEAERLAMTQPLATGELLYVTNEQRLYVGNGIAVGGVAITGYTDEDAQNAAASLFTSGTHSGITFTYLDVSDKINATIDLSNYNSTISGDLRGSVYADDSTISGIALVDGTSGKINLDGTVKGNIIPDANSTYDIGSNTFKFKDLYLSGNSLYLGSAIITSSGSAVQLPAGSTVGGIAIGTGVGSGDGVIEGSTYKINIAASDSSLMLNNDIETVTASGGFFGDVTGNIKGDVIASDNTTVFNGDTKQFTGAFSGNLTGNVTGDVTGRMTGDVTGNVIANDLSTMVDAAAKSVTGEIYATGLGVSIAGPQSGIFIGTTGSSADDFDLFTVAAFHSQPLVKSATYIRGRGIPTSPLQVNLGDEIYRCEFNALTSPSTLALSGSIAALVDPNGTLSPTNAPGKITISTQSNSGVLTEGLSIDMNSVVGLNANQALVAGAGSGQVDTSSVVSYVKIKVGSTAYAIPLYAIRA